MSVDPSSPEPGQTPHPLPGPWVDVWQGYRSVLGSVWRGDLVGALGRAAQPRLWLAVTAVNAALAGLTGSVWLSTTVADAASTADDIASALSGGLSAGLVTGHVGVPFGTLFAVFLGVLVAAFVVQVLRVVVVRWTFSLRGVPVGFGTAAGIVTVGAALLSLTQLATLLAVLVPGTVSTAVLLLVVSVLAAIAVVVAEIAVYVGVNRTALFTKSPAIPHAALTVLWAAVSGLSAALIAVAVVDSLVG